MPVSPVGLRPIPVFSTALPVRPAARGNDHTAAFPLRFGYTDPARRMRFLLIALLAMAGLKVARLLHHSPKEVLPPPTAVQQTPAEKLSNGQHP